MQIAPLRLSLVVFVVSAAACVHQNPAQELTIDGGVSVEGGVPTSTDLPCDVVAVLQGHCWSCHGTVPVSPAPMALVTHDDLVHASGTDATKTYAQLSLVRMQDTALPMPPAPAPAVSGAELAAFQAWVNGGAGASSCATAADPYATPTVCTSGTMWTRGDRGSSSMHPGQACIACHDSGEGPSYTLAGTVFPTAHEPDDCNGASGIQVVITGANGQSITLTANAVGNFYSQGGVPFPYTAQVVSNGRTRSMSTPQTDGDCNGCHTLSGANSAPGRIMAP